MEGTKEKPVSDQVEVARSRLGIAMIALGLLFLLDLYLQTGWLTLSVVPAMGILGLAAGIYVHRAGWVVAGCLTLGIGLGYFFAFGPDRQLTVLDQLGGALVAFGASWLLIVLITALYFHRTAWWALVPGGVILPLGLVFLFTQLRVFDFVLFVLTGLGLALLTWGSQARLFGLIIPGSLLLGIGPGIYIAWAVPLESNSLARVGIMLVSFALGWGLITLFSRRVTQKFVWWPIIPAAVLAISGWGLYISGNPGNAVSFISNTGSIGLILFGIYLLLLKRGIQK